MIGLSETIGALNFLLNLYKLRRESRSPQPADPDPDKVEQVIKELELKLEDQIPTAQDTVTKQIEKSLPPEQAQSLQRDLVLVEFLASAPEPDEFDYWTVLQSYVTKVQHLASRAQLFLSHGRQEVEMRMLALTKTSQVLLPPEAAKRAVRPDGPYLRALPTGIYVALTDETQHLPLVVFLEASFGQMSDDTLSRELDVETFRVETAQARNWLGFVPTKHPFTADNILHRNRFQAVEYRLSAADLKVIIEALTSDLMDYIHELKDDRETLRKIRTDLSNFMKVG